MHELGVAAFAAGEMEGGMRAHQRPAQAGTLADRGIDIGDGRHALGDHMHRFPPQRRLQPVGQVPGTSFIRVIGCLPMAR